jgi:1,4-dihydroxy-2-naphthoyl-CoA synthase
MTASQPSTGMTEQSTIHYERTSPQVARITFDNPPVNLIVGETVLRLAAIVDELADDPDIQVVVLDSAVPDFFPTTSISRPPPTSPPRRGTTSCRCGPTWC